jgi:hypothetical protein
MIVGGPPRVRNKCRSFWIIPGINLASKKIAMQRRPNWKPFIVPKSPRAESGKVGTKAGDEDRLVDIRFTIAAALALGLPALIGAGLYLAVTVLLRLS